MIVYGEILFVENAIIGFVLLYITAEIHGRGPAGKGMACAKGRMAAGALMCGFFSLTLFLPVRIPLTLLLEAVFAVAVCVLVFGWGRDGGNGFAGGTRRKAVPWRQALTFLLVTYFMGGLTMALLLVTGNPGIHTATGIYTGDMKAGLLALFTALMLFTSKQVIKTIREKKFYQEHLFSVRILAGGTELEVQGFLDTGNGLRDPVSGKPAAVAGEALWRRMEQQGMLAENRFCMIPYETVGSSGLLMGVRTDCMEIGEERIKGCVIARGEGNFRLDGETAQDIGLLLSAEMIKKGF